MTATEEALKEYFSQYGEVESVVLKEGTPRYGYVNFTNHEAAYSASAELTIDIDGSLVSIGLAKKRGSEVQAPPSDGIGLFNLPWTTTNEELSELLMQFAGLLNLKMVTRKDGSFRGYAFAYFDCEANATIAKNALTGLTMAGNFIDVKFSSQQSTEALV
uniref:RRM domain-containing protein n=1 Tax=Eutreptiella gymnastica TaxID=73025 RepID=A0A7S1IY62_9EUGL|mmetsp:Transcript_52616/g.93889  ORF Transcript_52616/g.93889 Transcript_52616/m.93889 type:complete len:160 (+) Transcript_52616:204-683(+)